MENIGSVVGINHLPFTRKHLFVRAVPDVVDEKLAAFVRDFADTLEGHVSDYLSAEKSIQASTMYTAAGKSDAVKKAKAAVVAKMEDMRVSLERFDASVQQSERDVLNPNARLRLPDGMSEQDARDAEQEIRSYVRTLDTLERETFYLQAAGNGDRLVMRALEKLPRSLPYSLSETRLAEGAEAFAQATAPNDYARLQNARAVRDVLKSDLSRALYKEIGQEPGVEIPAASAA